MSPTSSAAISHATNFLNEVFSRGGGRDSPYEPQFQGVIRQHLLDLVGDIPSLTVRQQPYTHYDGTSAQLLVAEGTVPMYYQGVKYNIPVAIWLPDQYPMYPAMMYVVPTPDMVIKPRHPFVDPSGLVQSPYLRNWQYPDSNLRELAQDASIMFSGDPPLYSKPPGWTPPSTGSPSRPSNFYPPPSSSSSTKPNPGCQSYGPNSPPAFHAQNPMANLALGSSGGSFSSSGGSFSARPSGGSSFTQQTNSQPFGTTGSGGFGPSGGSGALNGWASAIAAGMGGVEGGATGGPQSSQSAYPGSITATPLGSGPPAQQQQQQSARPSPPSPAAEAFSAAEDATRELQSAFRAAALSTLGRRLAASMAAASSGASAEVDLLVKAQSELERREAHLQQEVATLQAERIALDKAAQDLGTAGAHLDEWLAGNDRAVRVAAAVAAGDSADVTAQLEPDSVIEAADPLSQQALAAQAQDLALEDTLYALDKALNAGLVQADAYIKQVRAVCRQQFMARALGNKIAAKQNEARRRSPGRPQAAPSSVAVGGGYGQGPMQLQAMQQQQQGVQMPQGDSWYSSGILPNPLAAAQHR